MKRIAYIVLTVLFSISPLAAHTYSSSSVLSSGHIVKLQVKETGIYQITYDQIQSWGLNPESVSVLGYGGNLLPQDFTKRRIDDLPSVPFYMYKGDDNQFSHGDYILFYANGPVGWEWNNAYFSHTRNCYADYGCYFLSDRAGLQNLLTEQPALPNEQVFEVYSYTDLQLHEKDLVNLIDATRGAEGGGREFYGETIQPGRTLTIPFTFNNIDTTQEIMCIVNAAARSNENTTIKASVAGKTQQAVIMYIESSDFYTMAREATLYLYPTAPSTRNLPVTIQYTAGNQSSTAYLNYVEMAVPCLLNMQGNSLFIRNTEHIGSSIPSRYHLLGADASTQIWNITKPDSAYLMATEWHGDTLCWIGSNATLQLFAAVRTQATNWPTPASRGAVDNQDLHAQLIGKQNIIIAPEAFIGPAEKLKNAHEQHTPNQKWMVVTDEQVFNEFSSGTPDASAFRWMMKYLYDHADEASRPRSLLLFGDGSFDNRKLLNTSPTPTLLTYEATNSLIETSAYATDDYFAFMKDNDGVSQSYWSDQRARMAFGVGRLPVNTYEEAENVVDKIIRYMDDATAGPWKQQLCFLSDDGNSGLHLLTSEAAAKLVSQDAPEFVLNKIYLDAYIQESSASGESYPLAYNRFSNMLQSGVALMDYAGHGSANNICSEMFLTKKQVESMTNANLGVWALATCNFARFDQKAQSTAEAAVLNPVGGAIAVISADRTVYASENEITNKYFCQNLFAHTDPFTYPYTIGEALRLAKNQTGDNKNKLPFVLLGDPAVRLNYPTQYQVKVSHLSDSIMRALDLVTIYGYISNGDTLSSTRRDTVAFNGRVSVTVFDKKQRIASHDNDEPDPSKKIIRYFDDYPNKLFTGEADVKNGYFACTFRIPKDIHYNLGNGRITFYAIGTDSMLNNQSTHPAEAIGHYEQFYIGGSAPLIADNQGPDITLYLNTPLFTEGGQVHSTPHFFAELYDKNGINAVGSGIGHDLLLMIDNSTKQTYNLNDYYTAQNNSYQAGMVSYILPELADGRHSLTFRAWDLLNNASSKSLGFYVSHSQGPVIKSLTVAPNPVAANGELYLYTNNDRPDDRLTYTLTFYNMVGKTICSVQEEIVGNPIVIPMSQTNLTPGLYIYQFTIQTATQTSGQHTGRMMVY